MNIDKSEVEKISEPGSRAFTGWKSILFTAIAAAFSLFHIYYAGFGMLGGYRLTLIHLALVSLLSFFAFNFKGIKNVEKAKLFLLDLCFGLAVVFICTYIIIQYDALQFRIENRLEIIIGVIIVVLIIEGTRRVSGIVIPAIVVFFILYAFLGPYLPTGLSHKGVALDMFIHYAIYSTEGVFGVPLLASATFIIVFIIFAAFLKETHTGDFFIKIAYSLFGGMRGGPAKCAVVGSGLFGCISGSSVANVVGTGSLTIPLMKNMGYSPVFAGAVEAVASAGGQLMPPLMGAAAFLMVEILGIPYVTIIKMAALPAVAYYISLFITVDAESVKLNLKGLKKKELPHFRKTFREGWFLFFPVVILLYMLIGPKYSPMKCGFWAIIAVVVTVVIAALFSKKTLMNLKQILRQILSALEEGALNILQVAMICASAGIIICCMTITGLGIKISSFLVQLSGENMFILLIYAMIASIILGMGMPTTASYIIVSILVAPTLVKMGMLPAAAHFFVFYFAVVSNITPPVCLAAYAAAAISGADQFKTGFLSVRIGFAGFIIPFIFVYNNALLMKGSTAEILLISIITLIAVTALGGSLRGFLLERISLLERIVLFAIAIMVVNPEAITMRWIGCVLMGIILIRQAWKIKLFHRTAIGDKLDI